MPKTIVMPVTLDTKGEETEFIRREIERKGHKALVVDVGVLGRPSTKADIPREEVARAGERSLGELVQAAEGGAERTEATNVMIRGLQSIVRQLHSEGRLDGIISLGGSTGAAGHIRTSEGLVDGDAWGKRARWVDYFGEVDGQAVGIALFDHPGNLRHPTRWHARDYGLFTANPFGVHHFTGNEADSGGHTLPAGENLTLRYRFVFHGGDVDADDLETQWKAWAHR